jgi:TonB family protein
MPHLVVTATLLCSVALAQQPLPSGARQAPVLISKQEPLYSEEARVAKMQGSVMVYLVIGEDGVPRNMRVVRSLGLGLDESAIASVAGWRFRPGSKDGQPVAVQSTVEVNFQLSMDPREWSLTRAQFIVPPGAKRPVIQSSQPTPPSGIPENASARVAFDVDPQGVPTNIKVEESSDPNWDDEVIAMIREWRFQAALDNGTAIQSHAVFDLSRGLVPDANQRPAVPTKKR